MVTEISTLSGLDDMRNDLSEDYILTSDIDASDTQNWDGGFDPIGTHVHDSENFTGSLDGQGYTISNLYSNSNSSGLFRFTENSTIENITFDSIDFRGDYFLGLCCECKNTTFDNVVINGDIFKNGNDSAYAGFLLGETNRGNARIKNCSVNGFIGRESSDDSLSGYFGGMVGTTGGGENIYITNSSADIDISGKICGGLIGSSTGKITVEDCDVTGNIGPCDDGGGLTSGFSNEDSSLKNCTFNGTFTEVSRECAGICPGASYSITANDCDVDFTVENSTCDSVYGLGESIMGKDTDIKMDVNADNYDVFGISDYPSEYIIENCSVDMTLSGDPNLVCGLCGNSKVQDSHVSFHMNNPSVEVYIFDRSGNITKRCSATGEIKAASLIKVKGYGLNNCYYNCEIEGFVDGDNPNGPDFYPVAEPYYTENFYIVPHLSGIFNSINFSSDEWGEYQPEESIYYDEEVFGRSSEKFTGLTTDEMTGGSAKENMDKFDFINTWATTDSYPVLFNEAEYIAVDDVFINGRRVVVAGGQFSG